MERYVSTGGYVEPSEPNTESYDRLYGKAYRLEDFTIMNRGDFLKLLKCQPDEKHKLASMFMKETYRSSAEDPVRTSERGLYASWNWWVAMSKITSAPMMLGALGYSQTEDGIYISYLYVRKHYQGMGVGSSLIQKVEDTGKKIALFPETKEALKFYKRRGYKPANGSHDVVIKRAST